MESSNRKIGIREYMAIAFLTVGTKLSDDTPTLLVSETLTAGWIAALLTGFISIIPVLLMIKVLSVHKGKNLYEVLIGLFGKLIGNLIAMVLLFIAFSALIIDSAIYTVIIDTMYFTTTPAIVIYGVLMLVCTFGAKKGLEQIGSVAWLLLFYIKVTLLVVLLYAWQGGRPGFIFPLWGGGKGQIIKAGVTKVSLFADFLYFGMIAPLVTSFKSFKKGTWIALAVVTIELTVAVMAYTILLDYTTLRLINYPFHEAIRNINIGFLTNVEMLFFPFWLLATFIRFSFYLYIVGMLFGSIFKIKQFGYVLPVFATLVVFIGIAPEAPTFTIFQLREELLTVVSPVYIGVPCLMWITSKIKGGMENEKKIDSN